MVGRSLQGTEIHVYNATQRRELQKTGGIDPPVLYNEKVLAVAKHDYKKAQYLHTNPIIAISIMKRKPTGVNVIHDLGYDPFSVVICSNFQIKFYNIHSNKGPVAVDTMSNVAQKIVYSDKKKSHTLCMHLVVINTVYGQYTIGTAITERQDAVTIQRCFQRMIQLGANFPLQIVSCILFELSMLVKPYILKIVQI